MYHYCHFHLSSSYFLHLFYFSFFFLMIRRPPKSTLSSSSAASDVYKRQITYLLPLVLEHLVGVVSSRSPEANNLAILTKETIVSESMHAMGVNMIFIYKLYEHLLSCLLYTSPSPRDS
eukprot:TRINITY_DN64968_c0_g1_i1.p1 TRINITY_DN64968_c0_g1~~TRINITY_DN64968_c0_g1_i1.p1  ORF type:complete len:119 (+),score=22.39 TRINITY_DN64968_c0_g1_i1:38-394(+)